MSRQAPIELDKLSGTYEVIGELAGRTDAQTLIGQRREDGTPVLIAVVTQPKDDEGNALSHVAADANLLATLSHRALLPVIEGRWVGDGSNAFAVVLQRPSWPSLGTLLARDQLGYGRSAAILQEINAVIEWARAKGIVHRSVTPETVFVDPNSDRVLVTFAASALPPHGTPGRAGDAGTIAHLASDMLQKENVPKRLREQTDALLGTAQDRDANPDVHSYIALIAMADAVKRGEEHSAETAMALEKQRQEFNAKIEAERGAHDRDVAAAHEKLKVEREEHDKAMAQQRKELEREFVKKQEAMQRAQEEHEKALAERVRELERTREQAEKALAQKQKELEREHEEAVKAVAKERAGQERLLAKQRREQERVLAKERKEFEREVGRHRGETALPIVEPDLEESDMEEPITEELELEPVALSADELEIARRDTMALEAEEFSEPEESAESEVVAIAPLNPLPPVASPVQRPSFSSKRPVVNRAWKVPAAVAAVALLVAASAVAVAKSRQHPQSATAAVVIPSIYSKADSVAGTVSMPFGATAAVDSSVLDSTQRAIAQETPEPVTRRVAPAVAVDTQPTQEFAPALDNTSSDTSVRTDTLVRPTPVSTVTPVQQQQPKRDTAAPSPGFNTSLPQFIVPRLDSTPKRDSVPPDRR